MTLDDALLYEAEFWNDNKIRSMYDPNVSDAVINWGFKATMTDDDLSWFCLLIREAIK